MLCGLTLQDFLCKKEDFKLNDELNRKPVNKQGTNMIPRFLSFSTRLDQLTAFQGVFRISL